MTRSTLPCAMHGRALPRFGMTAARIALVASVAGLAPFAADAQSTTVFKCVDARGTTLYTDEPCKGGSALEIRAGTADARAVERLERERDALDRSADLRIREAREAVGARDLAFARPQLGQAGEASDYDSAGAANYVDVSPGWAPPARSHRSRSHRSHRVDSPRRVVPARLR